MSVGNIIHRELAKERLVQLPLFYSLHFLPHAAGEGTGVTKGGGGGGGTKAAGPLSASHADYYPPR
jgi:hypothetical protein